MGGVPGRRRRLSLILATHLPLLLCAAASNNGEVRCFCNVPPCITTGYMCKSVLGACFSEARLGSAPAGPGARLHGCLDMLHRDQQEACSEDGGAGAGLSCCSTDMCNHVDGLAHAHAFGRQYAAWHHGRLNASSLTGAAGNASASARGAASPESTAYASGEVWLKAATIAVPVCGVVILVALVAAAVRILRRDARELAAASAACKAPPLARCKVPLLPSAAAAAHHHHHHHHHHNHHQEAAERRPDKNEANARRNRAAAHANLFRGDDASGAGTAGEPPAKLYHKAAIAWRADGCACPV
ncbi:BMP and activin membrane-bound inhibitor homolog [Schistocerca nitens]|uniref:BMP and activin membrane-bound inhibitor homolog n=1 Tax=Schistocerca nitens TaxID=7011 RepID=UPI0021190213|nr:BMP and activin membrane-bound inhibitor homolog [Schistocerca nitens]